MAPTPASSCDYLLNEDDELSGESRLTTVHSSYEVLLYESLSSRSRETKDQ